MCEKSKTPYFIVGALPPKTKKKWLGTMQGVNNHTSCDDSTPSWPAPQHNASRPSPAASKFLMSQLVLLLVAQI